MHSRNKHTCGLFFSSMVADNVNADSRRQLVCVLLKLTVLPIKVKLVCWFQQVRHQTSFPRDGGFLLADDLLKLVFDCYKLLHWTVHSRASVWCYTLLVWNSALRGPYSSSLNGIGVVLAKCIRLWIIRCGSVNLTAIEQPKTFVDTAILRARLLALSEVYSEPMRILVFLQQFL